MTEDAIKNVCRLMMHKNLSGHGTLFLNNPDGVEAVNAIHAQAAEIERLKGEYARGIEDAVKAVNECADGVSLNSVLIEIRALLPKQEDKIMGMNK